jgi:pimeloyl-ACP methyl ester carboxylesterase
LEIGRRLVQSLPQAEFVLIEGTGHNPMWDRLEALNQLVIDFLRGDHASPV